MARRDDITMEGVEIRLRNFSGKEGRYNNKGDRNFLVLLNDDDAAMLASAGITIKELAARNEDELPKPFVKVKVNFDSEPQPRLVLVTTRNKTTLTVDDMMLLDWAELTNVDLVLSPYRWEVNGKTGISLYLRSGYFTINESELDLKYADLPENRADSAQSSVVFREMEGDF
jgi:hypothetical protein